MDRKKDPLNIRPRTLRAFFMRRRGKLSDKGLLTLKGCDIRNYKNKRSLLLPGIFAIASGLWIAWTMLNTQYLPDPYRYLLAPALLLLLEGVIFVLLGVSARRMHRRVTGLSSASQLANRLGVEEEAVTRLVVDKGILPRCIVDGENLYDLNDFSDADTLLRASSAPAASPETLLRPAGYANAAQPEQLLRPIDSYRKELR